MTDEIDERCRGSQTYQLRPPIYEEALYFTIVGADEVEAMFVNSRHMESFQWVTALMTSYIKQLREGRAIADVIIDMAETFDPKGDYVVPGGVFAGREVNSVVHHLGLVLERHIDTAVRTVDS